MRKMLTIGCIIAAGTALTAHGKLLCSGDSAATAKFVPSADNPRKRALQAALKGIAPTK